MGSQDIVRLLFKFLVLIIALFDANAQMIYHVGTVSDSVDFGLIKVGRTVQTTFEINNTTNKALFINSIDPSFAIKQIASGDLGFEEFRVLSNIVPKSIPALTKHQIPIEFFYNSTFQVGKKFAKLSLGIYDPQLTNGEDTEDMTAFKEFVLVARRSQKDLDFFESRYTFDSTYVKPLDTAKFALKIKNLINSDIEVLSLELKILSSTVNGNEIFITNPGTPFILPADNQINLLVKYFPQDTINIDSASIIMTFRNQSGAIDTATSRIKGIGIWSKVEGISTSIHEPNGDFIDQGEFINEEFDLGDLRLDKTYRIKCIVINRGNVPLKFSNYLSNYTLNSLPLNNFQVIKPLSKYGSTKGNYYDTLDFSFTPKYENLQNFTIQTTTNLQDRGFLGVPPGQETFTLKFKYTGIKAGLSIAHDTLDLGKLISSANCPSFIDSSVALYNTGNAELNLLKVSLSPEYPITGFRIKSFPSKISPKSEGQVLISYSANGQTPSREDALLEIINDSKFPLDTTYLILLAENILPERMPIQISKSLSAKPGTKINVPIIIDAELASNANRINDILTYNPSILRFFNFETISTASEGYFDASIFEAEPGKLNIEINMPRKFYSSDTLILLRFDTFLGNSSATEIAFSNPNFGNDLCDDVFTVTLQNGVFAIDSVCGIEQKLRVVSSNSIISVSPNPSNSYLKINFNSTASSIAYDVIDIYGNIVDSGLIGANINEYLLKVNSLNSGLYVIRFNNPDIYGEARFLIVE